MPRSIRSSYLIASLLAALAVAMPLLAEEEGTTISMEDGKKAQEDLNAKFDAYVDEYPNLKEVKDQLKGSPTAYAVHLKNCREPTLAAPMKLRPTDFIVRLIVLDIPAKKSTIIRLNKTWGGVEIIGKTLDAKKIYQGQKKGDYVLNDIITVGGGDFKAVEELVKKMDFFKMKTTSDEVPQDVPYLMIEIVTGDQHKIVERYLSDKNKDDFFELARKIGKLAKMDLGAVTKAPGPNDPPPPMGP